MKGFPGIVYPVKYDPEDDHYASFLSGEEKDKRPWASIGMWHVPLPAEVWAFVSMAFVVGTLFGFCIGIGAFR